ncbi:MAG: Hpt domain-containing protein [Bacteroidia bacterium]
MDIQALKIYLNCDNSFLLSLVQTFIEEAREITRKIELAWQNENQKSIKLNAHKLLGSVRILELTELIGLLEKIEIHASEKLRSNEMENQIKQLSASVEKVIYDMNVTLEELES